MSQAFSVEEFLVWLERQWSPEGGLLGGVRYGRFDPERAEVFARELQRAGDEMLSLESHPARLAALLWTIPEYLANHREAVVSSGVDEQAYVEWVGRVYAAVTSILGYP